MFGFPQKKKKNPSYVPVRICAYLYDFKNLEVHSTYVVKSCIFFQNKIYGYTFLTYHRFYDKFNNDRSQFHS